jgi:DNA invertase Pin-like site-specific DNA recombinase
MSNRQQRQKRNKGIPLGMLPKDFRVSPLDNYPKEEARKMGLDALKGHREKRKDIDRMEREWVEEMRRIGVTWSEIAESMGVSRQAVEKRFSQGNARRVTK